MDVDINMISIYTRDSRDDAERQEKEFKSNEHYPGVHLDPKYGLQEFRKPRDSPRIDAAFLTQGIAWLCDSSERRRIASQKRDSGDSTV